MGGVYSGTGVTDDGNGQTYSFDPAAAGVGTHTITYTFTNANGCTGSASDNVEVFACAGAECANAIGVMLDPCGGDSYTTTGSTVGGTPSTEAFCGTSLGSGGANWYTFIGDGRTWTASTVNAGTNYDTKLWIYDGTCGALNCVTGNDDDTGVQSEASFATITGTTYYVVVGGFSTNEGDYELTLSNDVITGTHDETVCDGGSIMVNGTTYDANNLTGTEVFTNVGPNGCDSTVTVTLTILPALTGTHDETVCDGGSIMVNGTTYDASNLTGTETLTGSNGCDSVITVTVTELPVLTGTNNTTICNEGSVVINGTTYDAANPTGTEVFTVGANNCDSTVTVNLNVLPALTGSVTTTICATGSVMVNGNTYDATNSTGTEVFTNVGPNMCDSTVTVALNVLPALTGTYDETVCDGGSIMVNGTTYDASNLTGTEVYTNVGPNGCDSTVTVTLTILPALTGTHDETACDGGSIMINGTTYDASNLTGTEVFTNVGPNGCDSTVTVTLTILPALIGTHDETVCDGGSIMVNGTTYDASSLTGTEVFTNVGPNGCDSTVTVTLTIESAIDVTIDNTLMPVLTANQAGATYQWVDCDNGNAPIALATDQSYTATVNGNYAVEVTVGSCTELSACEAVTGVGVREVSTNVVSIYPNPTSGLLTIDLGNRTETVTYQLTTIEGRVVLADKTASNKVVVDLTNESRGIYFLTVKENNTSSTYKVVKQ